ncbi:MAG: transmembrane 220 family protein [Chitinophagaceae bacterium]
MRYFNLSLGILFVCFAALQYNDPDPYIWIPIYVYAASICFLAFRGRFFKIAILAGIFFCLVYALFLFLDKDGVLSWATEHKAESLVQTMKATKPWIEESREFGGLLIVIVALALNYPKAGKK